MVTECYFIILTPYREPCPRTVTPKLRKKSEKHPAYNAVYCHHNAMENVRFKDFQFKGAQIKFQGHRLITEVFKGTNGFEAYEHKIY